MALKSCMNGLCGASTSIEWRKGWALRSGDFANLCDKCGSAYEQSVFCDIFHSKDSGWRECTSCGKRLHCGCIASRCLLELLDSGGIICTCCAKNSGLSPMIEDEKPNGFGIVKGDAGQLHSITADNQLSGVGNDNLRLIQLNNNSESIGLRQLFQLHNDDSSRPLGQMKQEEVFSPAVDIGSTCLSNTNQTLNGSVQAFKPTISKANISETLPQTNLSISLGGSLENQNVFPGSVVDEKGKMSSVLQQASKSLHLLPKPPRPVLAAGLELNVSMVPQIRVARPPVEGRGRNQLLPRYWPRITDQELQQISGDSNSTIVPLFEKVLSASDAGRIGRLVLPKACAEAYFPPISQPEGLPLRIQDVKGKEWVFQFRFWPNNNSRMYVLEGVTPCMQSMQLQAGDTVTFSRMDPEGKLVMGFRKATNNAAVQVKKPYHLPLLMALFQVSFFSDVFENLPIISGYSGLLQSLKGSTDPHLNTLSKHLSSTVGDISWNKSGKQEDMIREGLLLPSMLTPERERTCNIGSKSKRLLIDSQDALELKLTWEETQDLLRPPPNIKPRVVRIEDHDFEEYDEPPVFGKRSIFAVRSTGGQEQWAQCDSCSKWRRLPVDVLLPPKWTCADNNWDQNRSSCSAPDQLTPRELENLLGLNRDFKKRRIAAFHRPTPENESSSGLDALANAAIFGDNVDNSGTTSVATTTKHPRHRPGCSCIVCIQPPSGKGKHKPTCTCVVCMTVKRRFKTLTMRKKKRQSEREAEIIAQRNQQAWSPREEAEVDSSSKHVSSSHLNPSENEARSISELESKSQSTNKLVEANKGQIDLNCDPDREDDSQLGPNRPSMTSLVQVATLPLETYLKENGLTSLLYDQQGNTASNAPPQSTSGTGESETQDNSCFPSAEKENGETRSDRIDESVNDKDPQ
ncbi:B3 domain-containing transcription repressor VAL2 [Hibiscus syriacus]|uniref:B3 domain-containing transcription repressor VAL2 n=1 Tax=Hibiscus syriacus TaxID=106335 RepID=A0A6A2X3G1_HIBSY|nr:B3 domain-containing transcription repressor VAL2 [Hibiscus syriacus]